MKQNHITRKALLAAVWSVFICLSLSGCSRNNNEQSSSAPSGSESSSAELATSSTEGVNQMTTPENGSSAGPVEGGTAEGALYVPGTYKGSAQGYAGPIDVIVEVDETKILSVTAEGKSETEGVGQVALEELPERIVEAGNTQIDVWSGATFSSEGLFAAVDDALAKAESGEQPES